MTDPDVRWSVDVYYSGFTTVEVEVANKEEAIVRGRQQSIQLLGKAQTYDPVGAMAQLIQSLEPWEDCDTATRVSGVG